MSSPTINTKPNFVYAAETEADVIVLGVGTCGEDLSLRLLGAGLNEVLVIHGRACSDG